MQSHPAGNEEAGYARTLRPLLADALARCGKHFEDYDAAPSRHEDPEARRYCPRCHGLYLETVMSCADCHGMELRRLSVPGASAEP